MNNQQARTREILRGRLTSEDESVYVCVLAFRCLVGANEYERGQASMIDALHQDGTISERRAKSALLDLLNTLKQRKQGEAKI